MSTPLDLKLQNDMPTELWAVKIGPAFTWQGNSYNKGPSSAPSVDGNLLYALGGFWRPRLRDDRRGQGTVAEEHDQGPGGARSTTIQGSPAPYGWGYTWSPLVDGEQVVCVPGGSHGMLAALDKKTGNLLWQKQGISGSCHVLVSHHGGGRRHSPVHPGRQSRHRWACSARDGKLLWFYERNPAYGDVVIDTPVFHDNHVFATVGFSQGPAIWWH